VYGLNDLEIGLMYLPTAAGSIIAAFVMGPLIDKNYRRHARKLGMSTDRTRQQDLSSFPIERARLEPSLPLYALIAAVMLVWGWALQKQAHLAVLVLLLLLNGAAMIGFQNTANGMYCDLHPCRRSAVC